MVKINKIWIIVIVLLVILAGLLHSSCDGKKISFTKGYEINYYIDTINGHIILNSVVSNTNGNISISSLELKD